MPCSTFSLNNYYFACCAVYATTAFNSLSEFFVAHEHSCTVSVHLLAFPNKQYIYLPALTLQCDNLFPHYSCLVVREESVEMMLLVSVPELVACYFSCPSFLIDRPLRFMGATLNSPCSNLIPPFPLQLLCLSFQFCSD